LKLSNFRVGAGKVCLAAFVSIRLASMNEGSDEEVPSNCVFTYPRP
jgi:hypothetical protein